MTTPFDNFLLDIVGIVSRSDLRFQYGGFLSIRIKSDPLSILEFEIKSKWNHLNNPIQLSVGLIDFQSRICQLNAI